MRRTNTSNAIPTGGGKPIQTYGQDRECAVCGTRLSRYNSDRFCGIHRGWGDGVEDRRTD